MRLYLVQHGNAKPKDEDPEKRLSNKGVRDVKKIAEFLKPLGLSVCEILHSGKARAAQTADLLLQSVTASRGVIQQQGLAPKDPVESVKSKMDRLSEDLMIVGHLPFLGKLASALLTESESVDVIAFQQGGVVCLERLESGGWSMLWMVTPNILQ
jgi:phosphohistidine phosphatase